MHLRGLHNTAFALSIVGYQYPHMKHERYDSDWLEIAIRITDPRGDWSATDPIMLTWEVAHLAEWLDALAVGHPDQSGVSFLEPNLRFELLERASSLATLRVYFEQESRPPWDPSRFGFSGTDVAFVDLHLTTDALRQAAMELRTDLQRFPTRVAL
jgi:hypothetical protein